MWSGRDHGDVCKTAKVAIRGTKDGRVDERRNEKKMKCGGQEKRKVGKGGWGGGLGVWGEGGNLAAK
jgi:hypothetical protein